VASDQSLAATLLKLVNSAYYGHYRQIDSIPAAIVLLGFHEVRNLTLATTVFRSFPRGHADFDRDQLWRHSLATAMAADRLARRISLRNDACFVCGLLHDIGKVALDALYPGMFRNAAHKAHEQGRFIRETETEIFGMDHGEVGGLLAERWELPPSVVEAIRHHHAPESSREHAPLAELVAVADFVTYASSLGEISNGRDPILPAVTTLPIAEEHRSAVREDLKDSHDRLNEFLGYLAG